jgi:hypothetical protein
MDKIKPGFARPCDHFSQDAPSEQDETISKIEALQAAVASANELQQSKHVDP